MELKIYLRDNQVIQCNATKEVGKDILESLVKNEKWLYLRDGNRVSLVNKDNILCAECGVIEDEKKAEE